MQKQPTFSLIGIPLKYKFCKEALDAILAIPSKFYQAKKSGKEYMVIITLDLQSDLVSSDNDFDNLPAIQVFDYCIQNMSFKTDIKYRMSLNKKRGVYDIIAII